MAARRVILVGMALLLGACAGGPKSDDVFLGEFLGALGGSYDNLAQSRASPDHAAVKLMIAPVPAPLVGDHVFYVQESAANDPRRVLAQHLYIVTAVPGRKLVVVNQADFAEPLRWRDGQLKRELFRSLLPQDLRPRPGCDLLFKPSPTGFTAATAGACRGSAADTGEALQVEQRVELNANGIALFEQRRDATGRLVYGMQADPWYRFARRADAPW